MKKDLHVKDFPQDLQRKLKAKAALKGITLKQLLIQILIKAVE